MARQIAFNAVGGMGDELVRLNATRQILRRLGESEAHYYGAKPYAIFKGIDFIHNWHYANGKHQTNVGKEISPEYDTVYDMRYCIRILKRGEINDQNHLQGMHDGIFIGYRYAIDAGYSDDGQYLREWLLKSVSSHQRTLWRLKQKLLHIPRQYVVVANGGGGATPLTKRMPPSTILRIAAFLTKMGIGTVLIGANQWEHIDNKNILSLVGKTSLVEVALLLEGALGVICCEGGVAHLASQLRIPCAVLFGPTDTRFWGYPANLNLSVTSPCEFAPCWFQWERWHLECLWLQKRPYRNRDNIAECMAYYNGDDVALKALDHFFKAKK